MKLLMVVYGAFSEDGEYRTYYDLVFTPRQLIAVYLGRMPRVHKKRPPLPRLVERQLIRLAKDRVRGSYSEEELAKLIRDRRCLVVDWEDVDYVGLRDFELQTPPALRRGSEDQKRRVLMLELVVRGRKLRFFTHPKLRESVKKALKSIGVELRYS